MCADAPPGEHDPTRSTASTRPRIPVAVVAGLLLGVAFAVPVLWVILTRADRFTGDLALIELRIRDVWSAHIPLTGAYSRYGWDHPGPFQFWLFAVPYRLLGDDANALRATALLTNLAVGAVTVWLGARRNAATGVIVAVTLALLVAGMQPLSLSDGWNTTVTVLPFALTVVAAWRALAGDAVALPVAAAAAMFAAHAHVGVGVVVVPVFVATFGVVTWRRRRAGDPTPTSWWVTVGVVAAGLVPAAIDLAANPPGNLWRIVEWSLTNDEPRVGLVDGARLIGYSTSASFVADPQLPGRFFLELTAGDVGVLPGLSLLALAAGGVAAHRAGWVEERLLCVVVAGTWIVAAVAVPMITLPLGWWLVQWLQPLGWITWMAVVLVAWRWGTERVGARGRARLDGWGLAVAAVVGAIAVADHWHATITAPDRETAVAEPVDELTAAIVEVADGEPVRLDGEGTSLVAEPMVTGVVSRLDALGRPVCVGPGLGYKVGDFRVCDEPPPRRFVIRAEPNTLPPLADATLVTVVDPLTAAERAEAEQLREQLAAVLTDAGRDDLIGRLDTPLADTVLLELPELEPLAEAATRLAELRERPGDRFALYLVTG